MPLSAIEQSIIDRFPDDIIDLIGRLINDDDIDTDLDEVKALMPSSPVVSVIASHLGLQQNSPTIAEIDQASSWMDEQPDWQERSLVVQRTLAKNYPFGEKEQLRGQIPAWMNAKWAPMLLFQWSNALRDAVLEAEEYVEDVT